MTSTLFGKNLKYLRTNRNLNQQQVADIVGKGHTTIGNWEKSITQPSLDELSLILNFFEIDANEMLFSDLENVHPNKKFDLKKNEKNVHLNVHPNVHLNKNVDIKRETNYNRMPHVITVDTRGNENIMFVPIKTQAGYLNGYGDPEFIESLPAYRLPGLDNGSFRMFEIKGQSMVPTLHESDIVVTRFVDNLNAIRNDRVHVVITKDDGVCAKRVFNNIASDGKLILNSENQARPGEYPPIVIDPEDVLEIWYVVANMTRQLRRAGDMYNKMVNIEARLILLEDDRKKRLGNA